MIDFVVTCPCYSKSLFVNVLIPLFKQWDPAHSARRIGGRSSLDLPPQPSKRQGLTRGVALLAPVKLANCVRGSPGMGPCRKRRQTICVTILHLFIPSAFFLFFNLCCPYFTEFRATLTQKFLHSLTILTFIRDPEYSLIFRSYLSYWRVSSHKIEVSRLFPCCMFTRIILVVFSFNLLLKHRADYYWRESRLFPAQISAVEGSDSEL